MISRAWFFGVDGLDRPELRARDDSGRGSWFNWWRPFHGKVFAEVEPTAEKHRRTSHESDKQQPPRWFPDNVSRPGTGEKIPGMRGTNPTTHLRESRSCSSRYSCPLSERSISSRTDKNIKDSNRYSIGFPDSRQAQPCIQLYAYAAHICQAFPKTTFA